MTETTPPPSAETVADSRGSERQASLQEQQQLDEENALREKTERKAVKRYYREKQLRPFQAELIKMQRYVEEQNERVLILFEGRDAAGKGGTIRRLTRYMNPRHYRVVALGKPTEEQRSQWFLQKYVAHFPTGGEIVLFDRSWYNRAMVEPVFGFCSEEEYDLFMRGVVGFEKDLVRQGMIMIKLYFSVSKEEQARRFARRKHDLLRQWKLSEVDIQAQERWDEFTELKYRMLRDTHTSKAPWTVIRSDNKYRARLNVMKLILNTVPYEGRATDLDYVPDPKIVISGAREIELMKADRLRSGKFTA
jgi:polyphosphate kinase 2